MSEASTSLAIYYVVEEQGRFRAVSKVIGSFSDSIDLRDAIWHKEGEKDLISAPSLLKLYIKRSEQETNFIELTDKLLEEIGFENLVVINEKKNPILVRLPEEEGMPVTKKFRMDNWEEYDAKDGPVDLPSVLVEMLRSDEFKPAPREQFKQQVDDVRVGQQITLPSLGQEPKHYGQGYQGMSFFVTEQMVEMWQELSSDSNHSIKRVLSGPMGVGKSYLALFLAAKAYAQGWPLLYVSDASKLAINNDYMIAQAICTRFLALNKDILTVADFKKIAVGHPIEDEEVLSRAVYSIFDGLLNQLENKTLLIIDEHGALFESDPPIPKRQPLLTPLMQLNAWNEERRGTRVVLTGTAHAKFEREYLKNGMAQWLVFVTPLSATIFDKLLDMNSILSKPVIRDKVKEITKHVPRELVNMAKYVHQNLAEAIAKETLAATGQPLAIADVDAKILAATDQDVLSQLRNFKKARRREFFMVTEKYFHKDLQTIQRYAQRYALAAMFLPRKEGDAEFDYKDFDYQFMDLGLVYRLKVGANVRFYPLCQAAKGALLDIYKAMPLPRDAAIAIASGNMTGLQFEDVLFQQLLRYPNVTLNATDLAGVEAEPVEFNFKHFWMLRKDPVPVKDNVLLRCYPLYPRFDYIFRRTFIQTSISDFTKHNVKSADIEKAFERPVPPVRSTRSFDSRNQIEQYLDGAFGGRHKAVIDDDRHFVVTREVKDEDDEEDDNEEYEKYEVDGVGYKRKVVQDFHIVYIRGSPGSPNHTGKVTDFPDVLHISLDELQTKLFGDLLIERDL